MMIRCIRRLTMASMCWAILGFGEFAKSAETVFTDHVRIQRNPNPVLRFEDTGSDPITWATGNVSFSDYEIRNENTGQTNFYIEPNCPSVFGFESTGEAILFAPNSTRINFQTSVDNSLAALWSLESTAVGFTLKDSFAGTSPFRIFAGAPNDSFGISAEGRTGLGTFSPQTNLHGRSAAGPFTFRMEDASGLPNTWEIEGGGLGFGVHDVTAGTLPFVILPGAPNDSLFVAVNGSVGIGTSFPNETVFTTSPGKYLNVRALGATTATGVSNGVFQGSLGAQNHLVHLGAPVNQKVMRLQCSSGFFGLHVLSDNLATKVVSDALSIKMANGNVGLGVLNPAFPLQMKAGARCTGTVWINACSRELKQDIAPITSEQAREAVRNLAPVSYRYKDDTSEQYVGFIAEDVPELVATGDRKGLAAMDITAVLAKVVQDQESINDEQQKIIKEQQKLIAALSERLLKLERKLGE